MLQCMLCQLVRHKTFQITPLQEVLVRYRTRFDIFYTGRGGAPDRGRVLGSSHDVRVASSEGWLCEYMGHFR